MVELLSKGCEVHGKIYQPVNSTDGIKNNVMDYSQCSHTLSGHANSPFGIELRKPATCSKIVFYPRGGGYSCVTEINLYGACSKTLDIEECEFIGNFKAKTSADKISTFQINNKGYYSNYVMVSVATGVPTFFWNEIELHGENKIELSRNYEFPVKIGNLADVEAYASSLINTEEQLLITREGSLYLTDGQGGYISCGSGGNANEGNNCDLTNYYNKTEVDEKLLLKSDNEHTHDIYAEKESIYNKGEVDSLINAIAIPPAENTHVHDNANTLINLNDSVGMLTYKGKVVVNNNEYSFRTLPRAKVITNYSIEKGGRLPWLQ